MAGLVSLRLPKEITDELARLGKLEDKDRSELVRELLLRGIREKKLDRAIELYRRGRVTLWKAARMAGLSLWEMTGVMKERRIEAQYDLEDLREDLAGLGDA
jgi:predicted HTH domain antitoxin